MLSWHAFSITARCAGRLTSHSSAAAVVTSDVNDCEVHLLRLFGFNLYMSMTTFAIT